MAAALWTWLSTGYTGTEISVDLSSYCIDSAGEFFCAIVKACSEDCSGNPLYTDADGFYIPLGPLPSDAAETADKTGGEELIVCSADSVCVKMPTVSAEEGEGSIFIE